MERHYFTLLASTSLCFSLLIAGCKTKDVVPRVEEQIPAVEEEVTPPPVVKQEEVPPVVEKRKEITPPPVVEEVIPEVEPVIEKKVETPPVIEEKHIEEYERSVGTADVSIEEFTQDKAAILEIISNLDTIMADEDYDAWVKLVDKDSQVYWSNTANLRKASSRLPTRGLVTLKSLKDYFTNVFISSRKGRSIDEIRYESNTKVKAVQVKDNLELVYYTFTKIDGQWKIHLPPI